MLAKLRDSSYLLKQQYAADFNFILLAVFADVGAFQTQPGVLMNNLFLLPKIFHL
jgi:hypothetical protein